MIFARSVLAGSFRARAINFHFAFLSGMGGRFRRRAAFLREMGIDLKNVVAKLHLATRPPPVSGRHRVIPLVSHSGGSSSRAFLLPSRSSKRALVHRSPRNIFSAILVPLLSHFFPLFARFVRWSSNRRDSAITARVEQKELSEIVSVKDFPKN